MKYFLRIAVFFVVISCLSISVSARIVDRIVAVVNRKVITQYQLQQAEKSFLQETSDSEETGQPTREKVLNSLIEQELIRQAAEKEEILVSEDDLNAALDDIKQRNNLLTDDQLKTALGREGKTWEAFVKEIREQIKTAKLVNREVYSKVEVSENEIETYYQTHLTLFKQSPPTVRVRHILLKLSENADESEIQRVKAKAEQLVQQLRAGADFVALAKQYSEDPSSQSGGELGVFKQGELAAPFDIAFDMNVGEISDPVRSAYGFHIINVQEKQSGDQITYETAKPKIRQKLFEEQSQELYQKWIANLKDKAYIEISKE
jgi:parvulin-like peptidyl-prolyl isomerase